MQYYIDYRNGSMGNTILAHALYACNQSDFDLANFFSQTGDSHKILKINRTALVAAHLENYDEQDVNCLIEVKCLDWFELLRIKLSYSKWFKQAPNLTNFSQFFQHKPTLDTDDLWRRFYQDYKDSSWPECTSFDDMANLPRSIQQELLSVYQPPRLAISTEIDLAEWLTVCYYDSLQKLFLQKNFDNAEIFLLEDYVNGKVTVLRQMCENTMHWVWNEHRSHQFYQAMLQANQKYLMWLDKMKKSFQQIVNNVHIQTNHTVWEQSLLIAKVCKDYTYGLQNIKWNDIDCNADKNNSYLNNFQRTYHGKTI